MKLKQTNCRGQAVLEALVTLPVLLAAIFGLIFLMWVGWLRFELSQMVQLLGACLNSTQSSMSCKREFRTSLNKFPGQWELTRISDNSNFTTVDLVYQLGRKNILWSLDEPKVYRLSR